VSITHTWTGLAHGGRTQPWILPTGERRITLRRNILLLAAMAVTATLAFLCSCQSDQQGGSSPSKTTAETQAAEQKSQTQGINEAWSELGPKVAKIMGSAPYRYAAWGYLEVDPSDGSTVRSLGPANRLYIPGSSTKLFRSLRPLTTWASTTASRHRSTHRVKSRTVRSMEIWCSSPAAT
jgi:hypothetical protein